MDIEQQAAAFLGYHRRRRGPWEDAWLTWSTSKDFHPADAAEIRAVVQAELLARCDLTFTDPMAVLA